MALMPATILGEFREAAVTPTFGYWAWKWARAWRDIGRQYVRDRLKAEGWEMEATFDPWANVEWLAKDVFRDPSCEACGDSPCTCEPPRDLDDERDARADYLYDQRRDDAWLDERDPADDIADALWRAR